MKIRREVLESVGAHARESLPYECCGILLAERGAPSLISLALRAENLEKASPRARYVLGHKAHLKAVEMEISGAARIAGYYHSHPRGDAAPSARDRELASQGVTYLIVGLGGGPMRHSAWRVEGEALAPQPVEVME